MLIAVEPAAERDILREQAKKTNKPANIIEKMIGGRLNKVSHTSLFSGFGMLDHAGLDPTM